MNNKQYGDLMGRIVITCFTLAVVAFTVWFIIWLFT